MNEKSTQAEDAFSAAEIEALSAWSAPDPPDGFADVVLAGWKAHARDRGVIAAQPLRGLAMAAAALLLLGGFLSLRSGTGETAGQGSSGTGFTTQDAGPGPEVREDVSLAETQL